MKKLLLILFISQFYLLTSVCAAPNLAPVYSLLLDSSASDSSEVGGATKTLSTTKETTVQITGRDGDILSLEIPPLPLGSEDTVVKFKLAYDGDSLFPMLVIDTEVEFTRPVKLTLKSKKLNSEQALYYIGGNGQKHIVPFKIEGDTLVATLMHFSDYQPRTLDEKEAMENMESWLEELDTYAQRDALFKDLPKHLAEKLNGVIGLVGSDSDYKRFRDNLMLILNNSIKEISGRVWSVSYKALTGYCISNQFEKDINSLYKIGTELTGRYESNVKTNKLVEKIFDLGNEEFLVSGTPSCEDIERYKDCAKQFDMFLKSANNFFANIISEEYLLTDISEDITKDIVCDNKCKYLWRHTTTGYSIHPIDGSHIPLSIEPELEVIFPDCYKPTKEELSSCRSYMMEETILHMNYEGDGPALCSSEAAPGLEDLLEGFGMSKIDWDAIKYRRAFSVTTSNALMYFTMTSTPVSCK